MCVELGGGQEVVFVGEQALVSTVDVDFAGKCDTYWWGN